MKTADVVKGHENQCVIEQALGVGAYREITDDQGCSDLPYRLAAFDGLALRERRFGFADQGEAIVAEALLQQTPGWFGVHEESSSGKSPSAPNSVAATRRAGFVIDNAFREDVATITALDANQWGRWANTYPLYRQLLDVLPSNIKIARGVLGEVLGFGVNLYNPTTKQGWILSVDVAPQYRGLGIGRGIAEALITELESQGCNTVVAMIAPNNSQSMRLFRLLGFVPKEVEKDYFGPGHAQIRFVRESAHRG